MTRREKVMYYLDIINKALAATLTAISIYKTIDGIIDARRQRQLRELEMKLELESKY